MAFELPEALTLAKQMNAELAGKTIEHVHLADECAGLIRQGFVNLQQVNLAGTTIRSVTSKGKWVYIRLEPDWYFLLALESGGKVLYHPSQESVVKFHVKLDFSDGSCLTVRIVGWGFAKAVKESELEAQRYPGKLGLSPVDEKEFSYQNFCAVLEQGGNKIVKYVLMEQTKIAGIGNGYLQDILFRAKLHPKRKVADLSKTERKTLYNAIRKTLNEAVRRGGSEFEVDLYDQPGRYKRLVGEHMKGKPCPACGTAIEKLSVLGGSVYVCPSCQK